MNQQAKRTVQAAALGGGIILAIVGAIIGGQALGSIVNAQPAAAPTAVIDAQPGLAEGPTKTPPPAVVEAPAAPVVEAPVFSPVLCPEGTTANAVDDQGNESNCQDNGPDDQPCVAYDDQNNCTAYYKP